MAERTCLAEGCAESPVWCDSHMRRFALNLKGDTEATYWWRVDLKGPVPEVRPDLGPCWLWPVVPGNRYGQMFSNGRGGVLVHRWAYEHFIGAIPAGMVIDHLCRTTACVRPTHLEPVTPKENTNRGRNWRREQTHCINGHPWNESNTRFTKEGHRQCRACGREQQRRRRA